MTTTLGQHRAPQHATRHARGPDPRIHRSSEGIWMAGSSPAMTQAEPLVLYPYPEHRHGRCRAVAGNVAVQPVAAQRAFDPEAAGHLVNEIARDRVDLVAAAVALIVERTPGEFADGREPAAEIVIGLHGIDVRQHTGDAGHRGLVDRGGGIKPR